MGLPTDPILGRVVYGYQKMSDLVNGQRSMICEAVLPLGGHRHTQFQLADYLAPPPK